MISRLRKKANHVGPKAHEDVILDVIDGERTRRRGASDSFLTARKLVADLPITPTFENTLLISDAIDAGEYSDIGSAKDHYEEWKTRTLELLKKRGVLS